jgi:hypothetical protein
MILDHRSKGQSFRAFAQANLFAATSGVRAGRPLALQAVIPFARNIRLIVECEISTPHADLTSAYVNLGLFRTNRRILRSSRSVYLIGRPDRGLDSPSLRKGLREKVVRIVESGAFSSFAM